MKNALFLSLILAFSALDVNAAESCQSIFRTEHAEAKTAGLNQKYFDSVQSYDLLKSYTEALILKHTDAASLVLAIGETQFAKSSQWRVDDILFFLLHLEAKQGLKIPTTKLPFQEEKLQSGISIQNHFDLERHILAQTIMGKSVPQIVGSLLTAPYVKSQNFQQNVLESFIHNSMRRMNEIISWYKARASEPDLINVFKRKAEELEKISSEVMLKDQRDSEFVKLLQGDGEKNPDLKIIWRVSHPENPVQVAPNYWRLRPHKKVTTDYIMDPTSDSPYVSMNRFMGLPFPDMRFFENVYKNYQDRIRDEIVIQVKKVEEALSPLRQSYGLVFEGHNNEVIGTIRVFDGTPRRLNDIFVPARTGVSPVMPFEAIFKARNIPVSFIKKLEKMRLEDPYTPIFELGKLSLEGSARVRDRSLKALELFLFNYYLNRYPNGIFVVHVASEAHLKLYQKRYGFEIEESVAIPGSDQVEHILTLPASKFREALKLRLSL